MSTSSTSGETDIVQMSEYGRVTIPATTRRILGIEGKTARLTIHASDDVSVLVDLDNQGRCTIPDRVRDHLSLSGPTQLRVTIEPV